MLCAGGPGEEDQHAPPEVSLQDQICQQHTCLDFPIGCGSFESSTAYREMKAGAAAAQELAAVQAEQDMQDYCDKGHHCMHQSGIHCTLLLKYSAVSSLQNASGYDIRHKLIGVQKQVVTSSHDSDSAASLTSDITDSDLWSADQHHR